MVAVPRRRQIHDRYFKQAKAEGYLARSAYKLKEINERRRILGPGDFVLDLGCAPGSWLQVAAEMVGEKGFVVGVDLSPVDAAAIGGNVRALVGDVFETPAAVLLGPLVERTGDAGARYGVVLSDMAPKTTGAGDHFRSAELCDRVLELLPGVLGVGGNLAMKIFEGERYTELLRAAGGLFREAKGFKPRSSRDVSPEMFIVCRGYKGAS